MQVKIKALDTFHDTRVHVGAMGGAVHRGQIAMTSEDAAKELEKAGLVEIVSEKSNTLKQETEKQARLKNEAKQMPNPGNKMIDHRKTK